jgi:hypothetical protein
MDKYQDGGRTQNLEYIKSMLGELRVMAASREFDMLEYLIEVAYLEANDQLTAEMKTSGQAEKKQRRPDGAPAIQRDRARARS